MTSDEELIRQRQAQDDRAFMITALDPERAPRIAPAAHALRNLLNESSGVSWSRAMATMLRASDIAVKTADNVLRKAVSSGLVRKTGEYVHKRAGASTDSRVLWLVEWPASEK